MREKCGGQEQGRGTENRSKRKVRWTGKRAEEDKSEGDVWRTIARKKGGGQERGRGEGEQDQWRGDEDRNKEEGRKTQTREFGGGQ